MANPIINIFRIPDLRKKVLFTILILIIFRIGSHIPLPGVNIEALSDYFNNPNKSNGYVDLFDLFSGGALKRFTIFALGIMPYISASIIIQLLTVIVPSLHTLSKEGHEGKKKISQYTKFLTLALCFVQSFAIIKLMQNAIGTDVISDSSIMFYLTTMIAVTTGTMVLMWLGEIITELGIGNGISLIIFAGIVVRVPAALYDTGRRIVSSGEMIVGLMLFALFLAVVAGAIMLTLGRRRIPLQHGRLGNNVSSAQGQYIPLPINAGNVIPIIFASSIIMFPAQLSSMFGVGDTNPNSIMNQIHFWMSPGKIPYMIVYSILIFFFCYFYATVIFNPEDISENLKKSQTFIPGIRPGKNTSDYLMFVLTRVTMWGALFLIVIAIVPDFLLRIWPDQVGMEMAMLFGGTSLLIIVGVALDTLKQIESHLLMHHYDGFFKNVRMKSRR